MKLGILGRSTLRNPWSTDKRRWQSDPIWDRLFPQFDFRYGNFEDYAAAWYDMYYKRVDDLSFRYPSLVKVFETDALNTPAGQESILQFCGVDTRTAVFDRYHVDKSSE